MKSTVFYLTLLITASLSLRTTTGPNAFPITNAHLPSFCGPNCLTVFLKLNGVDAGLDEICALAHKDAGGTSLQGLQTAAKAKGIHATGVRITGANMLRKLGYPAIILLKPIRNNKPGHFVLVSGYDGSDVLIVNPPYVPYKVPLREFDKKLEGSALLLSTCPIVLSETKDSAHLTGLTLVCLVLLGLSVTLFNRRLPRHK